VSGDPVLGCLPKLSDACRHGGFGGRVLTKGVVGLVLVGVMFNG